MVSWNLKGYGFVSRFQGCLGDGFHFCAFVGRGFIRWQRRWLELIDQFCTQKRDSTQSWLPTDTEHDYAVQQLEDLIENLRPRDLLDLHTLLLGSTSVSIFLAGFILGAIYICHKAVAHISHV